MKSEVVDKLREVEKMLEEATFNAETKDRLLTEIRGNLKYILDCKVTEKILQEVMGDAIRIGTDVLKLSKEAGS